MLKKIIILLGAGLISFAGAFAFAWFTTPRMPVEQPSDAPNADARQQDSTVTIPPPQAAGNASGLGADQALRTAMSRQQLKVLINEVRDKIEQYNRKLRNLEEREQQIQIAQQTLSSDVDKLEGLRVELASSVAQLKQQRDTLEKRRIAIAKDEEANLAALAAAYDKMDSASAAKILTSMSQAKNNSHDDAVKILYYMTDRTKGNLLAELANVEPTLAAYFCQKLKQIVDSQ